MLSDGSSPQASCHLSLVFPSFIVSQAPSSRWALNSFQSGKTFRHNCKVVQCERNSWTHKRNVAECEVEVSLTHCIHIAAPSNVLNANRPHSSDEFITEANSSTLDFYKMQSLQTLEFYKMQSLQTLGESNDRVSVPICIESANHLSVVPSWIPHVQQAINDTKVIPLFCTAHPILRITLPHPRWRRREKNKQGPLLQS